MAPSLSAAPAQLRQMIFYHLDNSLLENASFLAQRLFAMEPRNHDVIHLLALCHFRLGQFKAAYDCSRMIALRSAHLGCAYVFAQASLNLHQFSDGITALERAKVLWSDKGNWARSTDPRRQYLPDAAAVYCLLGKLFQGNLENKKAIEHYAEALKLNPFMWDAFERLCGLGATIRPSNVFKANPEILSYLADTLENQNLNDEKSLSTAPLQSQPPNSYSVTTPGNDPFTSKVPTETGLSLGGNNLLSRMNIPLTSDNTSPVIAQDGERSTAVLEAPNAPIRKIRPTVSSTLHVQQAQHRAGSRSEETADGQEPRKGNLFVTQNKRTVSGSVASSASSASDSAPQQQRRSVRLFRQKDKGPPITSSRELPDIRKVRTAATRARPMPPVGRIVSGGNRKPLESTSSEATLREHRALTNISETIAPPARSSDVLRSHEATQLLLDLFGRLGQGHYALCRYQCAAALQHFSGLPFQQRETPWVLSQIGKAYFEQSNYHEAEKVFAKIKKMAPSRMEDMEIYSTILWHLKNDTELAFLSHELIEADRLAPQAWTTIGNCFSLQREHDQALKCFKRATQLDPTFAYGFTLQGHEHMANEEYDKALQAYRKAINADRRHYNGWYGLAKVYENKGKYAEAELYYRGAASINPNNAILECCIGVALERLKKPLPALEQYNHACEINPQSAVPRLKKAELLLNLRRTREALEEFLILKDLVPDESHVHFMLGRVYKMIGDKTSAIRYYTNALNLKPKTAPYIKEAMENLDDDDEDMDDDEDDQVV